MTTDNLLINGMEPESQKELGLVIDRIPGYCQNINSEKHVFTGKEGWVLQFEKKTNGSYYFFRKRDV